MNAPNDSISSLTPAPHAGQNKILDLGGRYKIAVCGRRFGKTVAAAIHAVRRCEKKSGQRVWWISPIQEQSDRVEREIAGWLWKHLKGYKPAEDEKNDPPKVIWEHRRQEHALIHLEKNSRLEFHSAHVPDRLRGAGLDLLIVDEAADISEYTWKMVLKPMLLEGNGEAIITGTPRGKQHWLHRVFLLGQDETQRGIYASIQLPSRANDRLRPEQIDEFRCEMTAEEFKQEFEAEFIDSVNSVFTKTESCIGGELLPRGAPGARYVTGIDLGEHKDYSVLISLNCRTHQVEGFARFHQCGWNEQIERIKDHLRRFNGPCVIDSTGAGDPVYELIWRAHPGHVEHFHFNAPDKENLIRGLQLAIDGQNLKFPFVPELLNELNAFTRLDDPAHSVSQYRRYGAPPGLHDDCVIALALAWWGLEKRALWSVTKGNPLQAGVFA